MDLGHRLGVKRIEFIPLVNGITAANNQVIELLGGILITITGTGSDGQTSVSDQFCYVTEGLHRLFLSKNVCKDLGIIDPTFPSIGTFDGRIATHPTINKCTSVPVDTWRTCLDAWNGFHSIPLKLEDRHMTTFITP